MGPRGFCIKLHPLPCVLPLDTRALRDSSALQARGLGPQHCFRLCVPGSRPLHVPTFLAVICAKVPRRRLRRRALSTLGWTNRHQQARGGGGVLAVAGLDCASCRESPRGLERHTRPLSDTGALPSLSIHRVYTGRVSTDSPDSDRVVTQWGWHGRDSGNNAFRGE